MSGSGWETLPYVREWSGAHPNVRERSGDTSGHLGLVERPYRMSLSGGRPFRIYVSGWVALPDIWGLSGDPAECSGAYTGYPVVVGWLFRTF